MVKAVLFDLDNTLIDFMKMKRSSVSGAVKAMINAGLRLNQMKAEKLMYSLYDKYGIEYGKIFQKFLEKAGGIDYKILASGIVAYRKVQLGFLEPYPRVIPTLLKLKQKGLKLAIVSDAPRLKAWMRLTELGIADFFEVVVAFGDVAERKPSRLPFEKALKQLRLKPSDVLMVGDNLSRDILGAKKLGMKTCFAKYGALSSGKIKSDFVINKFEEILRICKHSSYDLS